MTGALARPVPLAPQHDCTGFDRGNETLNAWLVHKAKGNQTSRASRTYVVARDTAGVGYYTCLPSPSPDGKRPHGWRRNMPEPIPAMLLGRLAVDRSMHGRGLGKALLRDAILRTLQFADQVAVRVLVVHATNETVRGWYE